MTRNTTETSPENIYYSGCLSVFVCEVNFVASTAMCFLFFVPFLLWPTSNLPDGPLACAHTKSFIIHRQTTHTTHIFLLKAVTRWNKLPSDVVFQKLLFPSFMLFLDSLCSLNLSWEVGRSSVCLFFCSSVLFSGETWAISEIRCVCFLVPRDCSGVVLWKGWERGVG